MGWLSSPPCQGDRVVSLGERRVQEMGMEKRVLLVLFSQKSHTSCSESQKGILGMAYMYTQGETRSRTQTDGNTSTKFKYIRP